MQAIEIVVVGTLHPQTDVGRRNGTTADRRRSTQPRDRREERETCGSTNRYNGATEHVRPGAGTARDGSGQLDDLANGVHLAATGGDRYRASAASGGVRHRRSDDGAVVGAANVEVQVLERIAVRILGVISRINKQTVVVVSGGSAGASRGDVK